MSNYVVGTIIFNLIDRRHDRDRKILTIFRR